MNNSHLLRVQIHPDSKWKVASANSLRDAAAKSALVESCTNVRLFNAVKVLSCFSSGQAQLLKRILGAL